MVVRFLLGKWWWCFHRSGWKISKKFTLWLPTVLFSFNSLLIYFDTLSCWKGFPVSRIYSTHIYIYIYTYTCYAITYIQLPNSLPPPLKKPKANQSTTLVLYNTFCQTGLPWCDATLGFPNCPNRLRSTKVTWRWNQNPWRLSCWRFWEILTPKINMMIWGESWSNHKLVNCYFFVWGR